MKSSAIKRLRHKLHSQLPVFGLWVTLDSPSITEMATALDLDWVVIDAEHGHLDWREITDHVRATVRSDTVCLVRLTELNAGLVKRALDIGADGVVIPWMETADQVRHLVSYASYPPEGMRGIGAERATGWGRCFAEHAASANEDVLVVPLIESVKAAENIEEMVEVAGTELYFFGPADFTATAGARGQWETPEVARQILHCKDVIRAAGKYCGVVATGGEDLLQRRQQGFQMLGLGLDAGLLLRSLDVMMDAARLYRRITPSLEPSALATIDHPLPRPPEQFRPDRPESVCTTAEAPEIPLDDGVVLRCQVGTHNGANGLTTGMVTFAPAAKLAYHVHPCGETITLLRGRMAVEVEGRRYELQRLDNITIPRGLAHMAENLDPEQTAELHVALASDEPARDLVDPPPERQEMPADSRGVPGAEHVVRHASAPRYCPGPHTEFVDYLNTELIPGIEMSGGWGVFGKGGRLPAHIHDFDESISITDGTALCVVEGRRYTPGDRATAHVPRGRVHYFINESDRPMEMVWVYAGPMPERLVVDETCATPEGNPWAETEAR